MNIKLLLRPYKLVLKHPFTISRRSFSEQESLVVEVSDGVNSGYGEATHNPYYPNTEISRMTARLEELRETIEHQLPDNPTEAWDKLHPLLTDCPFALCALDTALQDLHARKLKQPLYQLWGLTRDAMPTSSYTLSIATADEMIERMRKMPWPVYKIKLGTANDLDLVAALRKHTNARFRVDVNAAWTAEETIRKSVELKKLGVDFIEQPLPYDDWEGMKEVFAKSALPLIADESCRGPADVEKCSQCFHGINLKIMKSGGLTPTLRMIRHAKELGLQVMVGCMTESTVGISAIAQLLPLLDYADLDGALFLKEDIADGVRVHADGYTFPDRPGTGVRLKKMV